MVCSSSICLIISGILASAKKRSIVNGLLFNSLMLMSSGLCALTSICSVSTSILYCGSSLIEMVDNFHKVSQHLELLVWLQYRHRSCHLSTLKDLPSIKLFTTDVAKRPRTFTWLFFFLTAIKRPSRFLRL
jgi:hypothetical protein